MSLNGKMVLIIGGSSGIGLEVARQAAAAGAALHLAGRDGEKLARVAQAFRDDGHTVAATALDATDVAALDGLRGAVGAADHLVSTVGGASGGGFLANDERAIRETLDGKFTAALRIIRVLSPALRDGGSMTVTAGAGGRPHTASGAVLGNAAIRLLVEGVAVELAPRLRVNAIAPTWTDTPLWRDVPPETIAQTKAHFAGLIPLARTATIPELAQAYLFAITNGFLTGQTITIDGGLGLVS